MIEMGGTKRRRKLPPAQAKAKCNCDTHSVAAEITALVNTLRELAAIRSTAEDAAARILDSAEGLLALADKEEAEKAEEAILSIMTACGFHDLVGQRVTKITETLDRVIAKRISGDEPQPTAKPRGLRLEGPSLSGGHADQARIDALFTKKN